ncbi:MAG: single-stranded-DNA-specific exonuclease RecJ [Candidatus Pacebacteria bacterium]|nr:single-stranded-DNA-specific exonuclease RecJ [Candidatus Paceibacterota bacterium]
MKQYRVRSREHPDLVTDLLQARGVMGEAAQENFLNPSFERDSHDPMLLPDMEVAVDRILAAKKNGEHVCVWSDYDCDGIPGGVMLTEFLRDIGLTITHYIPHRHKEGFGLNRDGIDELKEKNVSLIITIDLGTSEHENIAYAKTLGIDVIVTDHHLPSHELPPALAVINPKRSDSKYPFDSLCGAGTAWKLVQGILTKDRTGYADGKEKWLIDLVGIATLSDMVPLVGENRMLAHHGLLVIRKGRRPGLTALLKLLRIAPRTLTEDDIGFMVAPRINAASRMDNPSIAARMLAAKEVDEATALAKELNHINDERKGVVAATVKEINHRIKESAHLIESPVIVMGSPKWRPGVLGLVANKLVETYHKPVFLWGREGGEVLRGSVRSPDINIVDLMTEASDAFLEFGGHHASGGFSVGEERVHELGARLSKAYETLSQGATAMPDVILDRELSLAEVPFALRGLTTLAPFGEGNRKPLFLFPRVSITSTRVFGKQQNHLEAMLSDGYDAPISGISFFSTPESFQKPLAANTRVDVVGHVERDWRGKPRVRIVEVL